MRLCSRRRRLGGDAPPRPREAARDESPAVLVKRFEHTAVHQLLNPLVDIVSLKSTTDASRLRSTRLPMMAAA